MAVSVNELRPGGLGENEREDERSEAERCRRRKKIPSVWGCWLGIRRFCTMTAGGGVGGGAQQLHSGGLLMDSWCTERVAARTTRAENDHCSY